ncbi:MAG: hypothetical protein U1D06_12875, partial [Paracoccaceae bacterium]|nr:hypothetical protein [Paracoccaceae bacterium]
APARIISKISAAASATTPKPPTAASDVQSVSVRRYLGPNTKTRKRKNATDLKKHRKALGRYIFIHSRRAT